MEREYANTNIIALNACAFASTFYFSHYTMQPHEKIKRASKPTHTTVQGFVQTSNSGAMNVNRFELLVCRLQTVVLRTNSSGDADNKGFKEMAGEVLNQTVVLLIKCSGRLTVCASKPPLLKPPKRYRSCYGDSANMKRTTIEQTNCNNMQQQQTQHLKATLQKKNKKNAPARKNSIAYAHCTYLPLPAITQSQPEGKVKRVQSATLCFADSQKEYILTYI